jgi:hypothetical protein
MDLNQINEAFGLDQKSQSKPPLLTTAQRKEILQDSSAISWFGNPKIQALVIGSIILLIFFGAYRFFTSGSTSQVAQKSLPAKQFDAKDQLIEEQRETINQKDSQLAFGMQRAQGLQVVPQKAKPVTPKHVVRHPRISQRSVVPQSQPRIIVRQVPVRQAPITPPPSPPSSIMPVSMPVQPKPTEDPSAAVARLNNLGVVVDGSGGNSPQNVAIASSDAGGYQEAAYVPEQDPAALGQADYPTGTVALPEDPSQVSTAYPQPTSSDELPTGLQTPASLPMAMNNSTGAFRVKRGENAKAKLSNPIEWNADINLSGQTFEAKLTEDLGSIPKGATVLLEPDPNQASRTTGALQLIPTSVRVSETEYPIPQGIRVVASNGGILQAKMVRPGNGFGARDALSLVAGVASAGLGGVTTENDDLLTRVAVNTGSNLINRAAGFTQQQNLQTDPAYFRIKGSVQLVASEDLTL